MSGTFASRDQSPLLNSEAITSQCCHTIAGTSYILCVMNCTIHATSCPISFVLRYYSEILTAAARGATVIWLYATSY